MRNSTLSSSLVVLCVLLLPLSGCRRPADQAADGEVVLRVGDPTDYLDCAHVDPVPAPVTETLQARGDSVVLAGHAVIKRAGNNPTIVTLGVVDSVLVVVDSVTADTVSFVGIDVQVQQGSTHQLTIRISTARCQQGDNDPDPSDAAWVIWRMRGAGQNQALGTQHPANGKAANIDENSRFLIAM